DDLQSRACPERTPSSSEGESNGDLAFALCCMRHQVPRIARKKALARDNFFRKLKVLPLACGLNCYNFPAAPSHIPSPRLRCPLLNRKSSGQFLVLPTKPDWWSSPASFPPPASS